MITRIDSNIIVVMFFVVVVSTWCRGATTEVEANLNGGNKAHSIYSNLKGSLDELIVDSGDPCRIIQPRGKLVAIPPVRKTHVYQRRTGQRITAAMALGRIEGQSVHYEVRGIFVKKPKGGGNSVGVVSKEETWVAKYDAANVKILAVPKYLYANATAAVPVKFQVCRHDGTPMDKVWIDNVRVTFVSEGNEYIINQCPFAKAFRKDRKWTTPSGNMDGTEEIGNGQTDTYVAWVPIRFFKAINLKQDTTDKCGFKLRVQARDIARGDGTTVFTVMSTRESEAHNGKPKIFGDINVKVCELKTNSTDFSILERKTKQSCTFRDPIVEMWHVDSCDFLKPKGFKPHKYEKGSNCPSCSNTGHNSQYPGKDVFRFYGTPNLETTKPSEGDKTKIKILQCLKDGKEVDEDNRTFMYDITGQIYEHHTSPPSWGEGQHIHPDWVKVEYRTLDLTIGCYFGASYRHVSVQALGTSGKGMDLREDKDEQIIPVHAFKGGIVNLTVDDLGVVQKPMMNWSNILGLTTDLVFKGISLGLPGWGTLVSISKSFVGAITKNMIILNASASIDNGEAYAVGFWTRVKPDGEEFPDNDSKWQINNHSDKPESRGRDLVSKGLPMEVGDVYVATIKIGATAGLKSIPYTYRGTVIPVSGHEDQRCRNPGFDRIQVTAEYTLPKGKSFEDKDIIHIRTQDN